MRSVLGFLLGGILVAGTAACAALGEPGVRHSTLDEAKMQQVEEAAARTGARVHWVNPPRKTSPGR